MSTICICMNGWEDSAQINAQLVEAGVFPRELRIYQEELERYFLNMTAEK